LGTERHEARRIDNQLRGRSGRQGDPGSSRFYVSLGDDLMRLFGSDRIAGLMEKMGLEQGQVIEHPWVSGSIEIAQKRVEQQNFEIRKRLLEYDNVMNKQREIIYGQRRRVLEGTSLKENILDIADRVLNDLYASHIKEGALDVAGLVETLKLKFGIEMGAAGFTGRRDDEIKQGLYLRMEGFYQEKEKSLGAELMRQMERIIFLQIVDSKWKEHLLAMDHLREGIGLRAVGQRDPLIEYKREAFDMFKAMVSSIEEDALEAILRLAPVRPERIRGVFSALPQELIHQTESGQFEEAKQLAVQEGPPEEKPKPTQATHPKVGRNDPCPCGSGKKYKKCCGR
jgi:preprotein translocase subunit SecA